MGWGITRYAAAVAALAAGLLATAVGEAAANAALCRKLESELASGSRTGGGQARSYDKAIGNQKSQIEGMRSNISAMGCGFLSLRTECSAAKSTLRKMESNLAELERTRSGMRGGNAGRDRARILRDLRDNGCRDGGRNAAQEAPARRDYTLFDRLFGNRRTINEQTAAPDADTFGDGAQQGTRWSGGNHRTLCVRTCDGYFFPISYSSSRGDFDRDTKACAAMCPGTPTALYHHRVPQEESEEMVSAVDGTPYADLPTAFDYREPGFTRAAACSCGRPQEFTIVAGEIPQEEGPVEIVPPSPLPRPDFAEDAETARNAATGLDLAALKKLLAPPAPEAMPVASIRRDDEGPKEIRVVGPAFLPDPEGAIDLRAPARPEIR
jgi:hypothetical protein